MADYSDMQDMAKTPEEKSPGPMGMPAYDDTYPHGLTISMSQDELSKLDLDESAEVGDMICFNAIAKVTAVMKHENEDSKHVRVELQITHMCCDDMECSDDDGDDNEGDD